MSLIVEVYVNDTLIARAVARNVSNLADFSDYAVSAKLTGSEFAPAQKFQNLEIKGHNRNQPPWSLIEKMMQVINPSDPWEDYLQVRLTLIKRWRSQGYGIEAISNDLSCDPAHVSRLMLANGIE